ncbi:MAG: pseudouridine-5-phosphate glycosidase, partial [Acidobacteria bacterium]
YQCDEMPAFYSRLSGLQIDMRAESPADVAAVFKAQRELGINSSLLVTVPVPADIEVPAEQLRRVLNDALAGAKRNSVGGRELTPFLLSHMSQHSGGATLRANIALLENNARVAAEIASVMSDMP